MDRRQFCRTAVAASVAAAIPFLPGCERKVPVAMLFVYVSVWCAARVFRIGLLMTGKPPNFRTLIRWIRAAH
jgi:hypothetical protein